MRLTRVTGLPVVDTHVARQAGIVSDVLLDLHAGRVAVLNVKHADGWLVKIRFSSAADLKSLMNAEQYSEYASGKE